MLLGETTGGDPAQLVGYGIITTVAVLVNQAINLWRAYRKEQADAQLAALAAKTQARRDDVAIRKDELAICTAEDDHVQAGYEKLLARTNARLTEVEKELTEVYVKLGNCEKEHARTEERSKNYEQRLMILEAKYSALRKKIPGFDSDFVPEAAKPPA